MAMGVFAGKFKVRRKPTPWMADTYYVHADSTSSLKFVKEIRKGARL